MDSTDLYRLRRHVIILSCVAITTLLGLLLIGLWRSHDKVTAAGEQLHQLAAFALDNALQRNLSEIDVSLFRLRDQMQGMEDAEWWPQLAIEHGHLAQVRMLAWVAADGQVLQISRTDSVTSSPWVLPGLSQATVVGDVRGAHMRLVPASDDFPDGLRLRMLALGEARGFLIADIDQHMFDTLFAGLSLGRGSRQAVLVPGGGAVLDWPHSHDPLLPDLTAFTAGLAPLRQSEHPQTPTIHYSKNGMESWLVVDRWLAQDQLLVRVASPMRAVMAPWWQEAGQNGLLTLAALAAIIALARWLRANVMRAARDTASMIRAEHQFRAVFDTPNAMMVITDAQGSVIEMNRAGWKVMPVTSNLPAGTPFWESPWWRGLPTERDRLQEAIRNAGRGLHVRYESGLIGRQDRMAQVALTLAPVTDIDGRVERLVIMGRDVTQDRRNEQALTILATGDDSAPTPYHPAIHALAVGLACRWAGFAQLAANGESVTLVVCWDGDGFVQMPGYALAGTPCAELYQGRGHVVHLAGVSERFPAFPFPGIQAYFATLVTDTAGRPIGHVFALSLWPRRARPQPLLEVVARRIARDFEREGAARELRLRKAEAEAASMAKSEFLSRLSHELRTPLNAVLGFAELLEIANDPVAQADFVAEVRGNADKLNDLVTVIMDFAEVQAGRYPFREAPIDLNAVIEVGMTRILPQAQAQGIHVHLLQRPTSFQILGDEAALDRALAAVLDNAVQFSRPGDDVALNVELDGLNRLVLRITDTGSGIDSDLMPRLFQPFTRSQQSRVGGLGMGLALSRQLIELHGGTIEIESLPDRGTSVALIFPHERVLIADASSIR